MMEQTIANAEKLLAEKLPRSTIPPLPATPQPSTPPVSNSNPPKNPVDALYARWAELEAKLT